MRRVKVNYTVNGYTKYVLGTVVAEDETFISIRSDSMGDVFKIAKTAIVEEISLGGGGQYA